MHKVLVLALLIAGIGAGAHAFYSAELHESPEPMPSKSLTQSQDSEPKNKVLYAGGNVPCNPAKEVCEE